VEKAAVDESQRMRLVASCIAYCRAPKDSPEQETHFWAMDAIYGIA
jgi:hypothetical protein